MYETADERQKKAQKANWTMIIDRVNNVKHFFPLGKDDAKKFWLQNKDPKAIFGCTTNYGIEDTEFKELSDATGRWRNARYDGDVGKYQPQAEIPWQDYVPLSEFRKRNDVKIWTMDEIDARKHWVKDHPMEFIQEWTNLQNPK